MPTPNALRRQRYAEARALGLSSQDATFFRSRSSPEATIPKYNEIEREIRLKPRQEQTPEDRELQRRLTNLISRQIRAVPDETIQDSQPLRESEWSLWSRFGGEFPPEHLTKIVNINLKQGKPQFDKFGFIQYYYEYVEDLSEFEAEKMADQGSP